MASMSLLFGVALLVAATKYFSLNPIQQGMLFRRMYVALFFIALIIFLRVCKVYSLQKKNKIEFREVNEEVSPNVNTFIDYLRSTYLWRLTIIAVLAILSALSLPWISRPSAGDSTLIMFLAIAGTIIVLVTIPWIIYILIKR